MRSPELWSGHGGTLFHQGVSTGMGSAKDGWEFVKKTLTWALTATVLFEKPTLSYNELQTILSEVANVVNDMAIRP